MIKISIVGRKNVGKSSLFNFLTKSNISTSIDYSGYTSDCISADIKIGRFVYKLIDTPGIGYDQNEVNFLALKKAWQDIKSSDLIICLFDFFDSLNLNIALINLFKNLKNKKIYVVSKSDLINKLDGIEKKSFYKNFLFISIKNGNGLNTLFENINIYCAKKQVIENKKNGLKFIILGKPNVGKSSFCNKILEQDVSLVLNSPGTTKDFILNSIVKKNNIYTLIDTPGIMKGINNLDKLFLNKIILYVKNCDIVFYVVAVGEKISKYDYNIIKFITTFNKKFFLILNKSDLFSKTSISFFCKNYYSKLTLFNNVKYRFVSSKYGFGISDLFEVLLKVEKSKLNFEYNKVYNFFKNMLIKYSVIKRIQIIQYFPFLISIYLKKKISYNKKIMISSYLIHTTIFKNISVRILFK